MRLTNKKVRKKDEQRYQRSRLGITTGPCYSFKHDYSMILFVFEVKRKWQKSSVALSE